MAPRTGHRDTFVLDRLPAPADLPECTFDLPELRYPERLNCAVALLDDAIEEGYGEHVALIDERRRLTYAGLLGEACRIAAVLVDDLGLVSGARVLVRGFNDTMTAACWYAIVRAGGVAVLTMPLLRAGELVDVIERARPSVALCDAALGEELARACELAGAPPRTVHWASSGTESLEHRARTHDSWRPAAETFASDPVLIAFTSGTTGEPKGTVHFHRDVLAVCDTFAAQHVRAAPSDVFCGTPPLAFTFGLGGLLLFAARARAATLLLPAPGPDTLVAAANEHGATICFAAPTAYRAMTSAAAAGNVPLRACVSAGEMLPVATRSAWKSATGIDLIDGIGSTEMLHIFIAASGAAIRPGATGTAVRGYTAAVLDDTGSPVPAGTVGRLAVKGPTGCRYLADARQRHYVRDGWNLTGDAYLMDDDGYFWYQARTDDMIVSSGYNIAGPEVEFALFQHPGVRDCAVVGIPDAERGALVKAFVVLRDETAAGDATARELQTFVKATIAPYKYPRAIEFVSALPRTQTGKLQRYLLRERTERSS